MFSQYRVEQVLPLELNKSASQKSQEGLKEFSEVY